MGLRDVLETFTTILHPHIREIMELDQELVDLLNHFPMLPTTFRRRRGLDIWRQLMEFIERTDVDLLREDTGILERELPEPGHSSKAAPYQRNSGSNSNHAPQHHKAQIAARYIAAL